MRLRLLTIGCHTLLIACAAEVRAADTFAERVAPIFERHCVSCHSGEYAKGGFDLTTAAKAFAGGESGTLLVPGKPDESSLLEYISGDESSGEGPAMPKDAPALKAEDVETVRAWIAAGAEWPADLVLADKKVIDANWWSLLPWQEVAEPPQEDPWIRTPIDAFILAKLGEQRLAPSGEADRPTLIRRLTYDLHGLPPTPEEVDAFVADPSDRAYENLVDRLLASPRYGERWARHWLDVVHYGETHGYDKDKTRPNAWPYRDYVIRSLNADKPYDRFVAEQIAGDVLDPGNPDAVVATGFIAAGPWDFVGHTELREGTTDKEIARSNDRDDMLASTMSTFMSLTVHCARCHNHKFDPIAQRDYYALQAVFAGVDRAERPYDADPAVARRRIELQSEQERLEQKVAAVQAEIASLKNAELAAIDAELATREAELEALPPAETSQTLGYHSQIMPRADATKWVQIDLGESLALDEIVIVPAHEKYGGHPGPGFGFPPRYRVELSDDAEFASSRAIVDLTAADVPHPGDRWQRHSDTGMRGRYVRVTATKLWERTSDWIFALGELVVLADGKNVALNRPVTALDSIEAAPSWAISNLVDGFGSRQRVATAEGLDQRRLDLETAVERIKRERHQLAVALLGEASRAALLAAETRLPAVQAELAALPEQQRLYATTHNFTPRPIHLLARGDVNSRGEPVAPAGVACVAGPEATFTLIDPDDEGQRRAALARWLTDPRNALLRRSIVNRVWQYHFGRGIVDSPNDFGRMGSLPTHPELLEWLAARFAAEGHSLKALHRLILTSAVYRQSSQSNPAFEAIDGGNQYLWRMNRGRLDAESTRDTLLFVSGKLDLTMGGPSVQQFFFKDDHSPVYDYAQFDVDDPRSMRRSVYRFLVRSVPDPLMDCLDCADPSILTPRRNATLTSVQALALLNNPLVVRQAEHFAARLEAMHSEPAAQIEAACRLALGRKPTDAEIETLTAHVAKHGLPSACRVIFNSNAFLFVDWSEPSMTVDPANNRRATRREFLWNSGGGLGGIALARLLAEAGLLAPKAGAAESAASRESISLGLHHPPRAKRVVQLFMSGAASQCDMFDYKPALLKRNGQPWDPGEKVELFQSTPGHCMQSPWSWQQHGECGHWMSSLVPELATCVDDIAFLHGMVSKSNVHGPATFMQNSGFVLPGFPSMGAWVSYGLGSLTDELPTFVVLPDARGFAPNGPGNWSAGFLPAAHQGTLIKPAVANPISDLFPPREAKYITAESEADSLAALKTLNEAHLAERPGDSRLDARIASYELAAKLQLSAPEVLDISAETEATRKLYGLDDKVTEDFGRNCLIARRMLERGVRFVQVWSGADNGFPRRNWDSHEDIARDHGDMGRSMDRPAAALIKDLKARGLFDDTIVIWTTEFGRMPCSQGGKGRDHNPFGFTSWLAGGGIRGGVSYGATDEWSYKAVENPTYCYDLHATVLHLLGIDHERLTFRHNGIDRRLTDVHGRVIKDVLA